MALVPIRMGSLIIACILNDDIDDLLTRFECFYHLSFVIVFLFCCCCYVLYKLLFISCLPLTSFPVQ